MFECKSQVHISNTLRRKLDPKTKDCIFLGYKEGVKAEVFEHMATSQRMVSRDSIVKNVRLNLEPILGSSPEYQGKRSTVEVSLEQPKEDRHEPKFQSPITKENFTTTQEGANKSLTEREEMPTWHP